MSRTLKTSIEVYVSDTAHYVLNQQRFRTTDLGEGAFGKVELATHKYLKSKVALKLINLRTLTDTYVR